MTWNNFVHLTGRAGQDMEINTTTGGMTVGKFSLAVNRGRDKDPSWFKIVAFDKTAEFNPVGKGNQVTVTGTLSHRTWENKEGDRRDSVEIIAEVIAIHAPQKPQEPRGEARGYGAGVRQGGDGDRASQRSTGARFSPPSSQDYDDSYEDELPF